MGVRQGPELELHLAGREGLMLHGHGAVAAWIRCCCCMDAVLLLHGHGAVAAQHCDTQCPVPDVSLLVPLTHGH